MSPKDLERRLVQLSIYSPKSLNKGAKEYLKRQDSFANSTKSMRKHFSQGRLETAANLTVNPLEEVKASRVSLDRAILKEAPQNGMFEYYLHKSTPKMGTKQAKVGTGPQFEYWRHAARQITKQRPVSKGSTDKPWRGNTKLEQRPSSAALRSSKGAHASTSKIVG